MDPTPPFFDGVVQLLDHPRERARLFHQGDIFSDTIPSTTPVAMPQTLEQARIEVEREHELECIRQAAATLNRQRADEAQRVLDLKQAVVLAEREKEELRRRRREEAAERRVAKEKVACLQLMRQVLPLSLERALEELIKKSWVTPTDHQVMMI